MNDTISEQGYDILGQFMTPDEISLIEWAEAVADAHMEHQLPAVIPPFGPGLLVFLARQVVEAELEPEPTIPDAAPPVDIMGQLEWNWGAQWPFPSRARSLADIEYITVHHSGSTDRDLTSISSWYLYHTRTKSWSSIGYHFCIASFEEKPMDGGVIDLYQCNPLEQVTWHDTSNYRTVGVVFAGDLRAGEDGSPNGLQVNLWGRLMGWLIPQLPNLKGIVPHSYFQSTACPGDWVGWSDSLVESALGFGQDISGLLYDPKRVTSAPLSRIMPTLRMLGSRMLTGENELEKAQRDV